MSSVGRTRWLRGLGSALAFALLAMAVDSGVNRAAAEDLGVGAGPPIVNTASDVPLDPGCNPLPGDCTLREAILYINATHAAGIALDLPIDSRLSLSSPLPPLTAPTTIQPRNGSCPELRPTLTVDGSALSPTATGLVVDTGTTDTTQRYISGLAFVNFGGEGMRIQNSRGLAVLCTNLGIDTAGAPGPNGTGLRVVDSVNIRYGSPGLENVIAANLGDGILVERSSAYVSGGTIGASDVAAGNGGAGIRFIDAPYGGIDTRQTPGVPRIHSNAGPGISVEGSSNVSLAGADLADNGGLGIDLGNDGVTANDVGDGDGGPNGLANRPTVRRIDRDGAVATVSVRITGVPDQSATIDVYSSPACDPSGTGEGATFVGQGVVNADSDGVGVVSFALDQDVTSGVLTATATDSGTSEFSACLPADGSANEPNPWQPPAEPIVWDGFGLTDLWVGAVGAAPHRILEGSASAPAWNPDRSRIVFASNRGGDWDLWTVAIDGSDLQQLTHDAAVDQTPAWSPDGARIAYSTDADGDFEIVTISADGAGRMPITDDSDYDAHPTWSPDGRRLAFDSSKDIWLVGADGTDPQILTGGPGVQESPAWSPDGRRLAYTSTESGAGEVHTVMVANGDVTRVTTDPAVASEPSWSPSGDRLVFASTRSGSRQLWVMNADGSQPTEVSAGVSGLRPDWGPAPAVAGIGPLPGSAGDLIPISDLASGELNVDRPGNRVLMTSADGSRIILIDAVSRTVIAEIDRASVAPFGSVLLDPTSGSIWWVDTLNGDIALADPATLQPGPPVALDGVGSDVEMWIQYVAVDEARGRVHVTVTHRLDSDADYREFDLATGAELARLSPVDAGSLYDLVLDEATGAAVISANDRTVRVITNGVQTASITSPEWVLDLVAHPEGHVVFGADYAGAVHRFDLDAGTLSATTQWAQWFPHVAVDPEREQVSAVVDNGAGGLEVRTMSTFDLTELGRATIAEPSVWATAGVVTDQQGNIWIGFSTAGYVATYRPEFGATNLPPAADDASVITTQEQSVDLTLTGSDPDEAQTLTFQVTTPPSHGTVSGDAPQLTYEPELGFIGEDSLQFTVSDGVATSAPATVTLTVQPAEPNVVDGFGTVVAPGGAPVTFTVPTDAGDPPVVITSPPEHGSIEQNGATLTYDPDADYEGPDAVSVQVGEPGPAAIDLTIPLLATPAGRATFVVNTIGAEADLTPGDGVCATAVVVAPETPPCSLRAAVMESNASTDLNEIWFGIPTNAADADGRFQMKLPAGGIPVVTQPVRIDATTQAGFSPTGDAEPVVVLRRGGRTGCGICLRTSGSTVRGLSISGFNHGVLVDGPDNTVEGNWLGYDGYEPGGNNSGVWICGPSAPGCSQAADRTTVGGTAPGQRNVISGNGSGSAITAGVAIYSDHNVLVGNWIGFHPRPSGITRDCVLSSWVTRLSPPPECSNTGVLVEGDHNRIGGPTAAERNIVSHTSSRAIFISHANDTTVQGNWVGSDDTGNSGYGNYGDGIVIGTFSADTLVGGATPGAGNVVLGSVYGIVAAGLRFTIAGNHVGVGADGTSALPNRIGIRSQVAATASATGSIIGGTDPGARNLISGNNAGLVQEFGSPPRIVGNWIGTNAAGSAAVPNNIGVRIVAPGTILGGHEAGEGNTISGNRDYGVVIGAPAGITLQGNRIGTNPTGTAAIPNRTGVITNDLGFTGLSNNAAIGGTDGVTLGGACTGACNLISGNAENGLELPGTGHVVSGNFIGTDITGNAELGNGGSGPVLPEEGFGIYLAGSNNRVGGTAPAERNVIGGNKNAGINLNYRATANQVLGNHIGLGSNGSSPIGNHLGGVWFDNLTGHNSIGGTIPGAGNSIWFNGRSGIHMAPGAYSSNHFLGNSIDLNGGPAYLVDVDGGLGIDLPGVNRVNQNDVSDRDSIIGGLDLQNFPTIGSATSAGPNQMNVSGGLDTTRNRTYRVELFSSPTCDPSGFGEGRHYLGGASVATGPTGAGVFSTTVAVISGDRFLTSTATSNDGAGATSEFSQCFEIPPPETVGIARGVKFEDLDDDGVRDVDEPTLADWTISAFADPEGDGFVTGAESVVSTTTDADGTYSLGLLPGHFVICETNKVSWRQTAPTPADAECGTGATGLGRGGFAISLSAGEEIVELDFGNHRDTTVSGYKFHDLNGDGVRQETEPGLSGWTITAFADNGDGVLSSAETQLVRSAVTDLSGRYDLILNQGHYVLCETAQPSWHETTPAPADGECAAVATQAGGGHAVTVISGVSRLGLDFGNQFLDHGGVIKFNDLDANGVRNDEPLLADWTMSIFADVNGDGDLGANENTEVFTGVTDENGHLGFELPAGDFVLCEHTNAPWRQTRPTGADHSCANSVSGLASTGYALHVGPGYSLGEYEFGNHIPGVIGGHKYHDRNGDGDRDPNEEGLEGWTVALYRDANGNNLVDANESTAIGFASTDADGWYEFTVNAGSYVTCETNQVDWRQTAPAPADGECAAAQSPIVAAATASGGNPVLVHSAERRTDLDFGNIRVIRPHGHKFFDANRNRIHDEGEPGLADWTITAYLDTDANGHLDPAETTAIASDVTDAAGNYELTLPALHYVLCETNKVGWQQTAPDPVDGECGTTLTTPAAENLGSGGHVVAPDTEIDNAAPHTFDFGNIAVFTPWGHKYNDRNASGHRDVGEEGLELWRITAYVDTNANGRLEAEETAVGGTDLTDADGYYEITLPAGRYVLCETQIAPWRQTEPSQDAAECNAAGAPGGYAIGATPGDHTARDFGNHLPGTPRGLKYNDHNANGNRDPEDEGLPNWLVTAYVDTNANGQLDPAETTAIASDLTDSSGHFSLTLNAGHYVLCETNQVGWRQTEPAPAGNECGDTLVTQADGGHALEVTSGMDDDRYEFGNHTGQISGLKYHDLNTNGDRDPDEPGLPDWLITAYIDSNANGRLDSSETAAAASGLTNALGRFSFHLEPGDYVLCETNKSGWRQTEPAPAGQQCGTTLTSPAPADQAAGGLPLHLTLGTNRDDLEFGNYTLPIVRGIKYNDLNASGDQDPGEPPLAGWTMTAFTDSNGNQHLDPGEATAVASDVTDAAGNYSLTLPAADYVVCETNRVRWRETEPAPAANPCGDSIPELADGGYAIHATSGLVFNNRDFGNHTGIVDGDKYNDLNGNGTREVGEPGLGGWTITAFVDTNGNRQLDPAETTSAAVTSTNNTGHYSFTTLNPGNYVICETNQATWAQTAPTPADNECGNTIAGQADGGHALIVGNGTDHHGLDFGNRIPPDPPSILTITKSERACRQPCSTWTSNLEVNYGEAIQYSITVRNTGAGAASNVKVMDTLPGGLTIDRLTGVTDTLCNLGNRVLTCTIPTLASNATRVFSINTRVRELGRCTITGTRSDDTLVGTAGDDVICGLGGSDTISGAGGDDEIWGDIPDFFTSLPGPWVNTAWIDLDRNGVRGDDEPTDSVNAFLQLGTPTGDTLAGQNGGDTIHGQEGEDDITGAAGTDVIFGNDAKDTVDGGEQADSISGNDGDDVLSGGSGGDTIHGNNGDDRISGFAGADTLYGDDDNDTIAGGDAIDDIDGGYGNDVIGGNAAGDTISGGYGNDTIHGDGESDTIGGGFGDDTIFGDDGGDTISGNDGDDGISGGAGQDALAGANGNDFIDGGTNDDALFGGSQEDIMQGGADDDDLLGGPGNDQLSGSTGDDDMNGEAGQDNVMGDEGDDDLWGGDGSDRVWGGPDNDRIAGDNGTSYASADGSADQLNGGEDNDLLLGQGGNDGWCLASSCPTMPFVVGPARLPVLAAAQLEGGPGADRLHGGPGIDRLDGGGTVNNLLVGGSGSDNNNFCSNGPLEDSRYEGTDRGDIRHISCRWPAPGQSQRAVPRGRFYDMVPTTINVDTSFNWANYRGQGN